MSSLEFSNCLGLACSKACSYKALGVSTQAAFDMGVKAKKERVGFERINE